MSGERRHMSRERQPWQPHPDAVVEAAKVLEFYGGDPGPLGVDVVRRVVVAVLAWQERHAAGEQAHARRRDGVSAEVLARVRAHLGRDRA